MFVVCLQEIRIAMQPGENHDWRVTDDGKLVGCDQQRAGTLNHESGVPALPLVTRYKFTNWPAVRMRRELFFDPVLNVNRRRCDVPSAGTAESGSRFSRCNDTADFGIGSSGGSVRKPLAGTH